VQIRGGIGACTGTLVTENVVLTAAHCLIEPRPTEVFFGAEPDGDGTVVAIEDWLIHPEFDELRVIRDLGLVRLAESPGTAPIGLSSRALTDEAIGTPARIVGFGRGKGDEPRRKRQGWAEVAGFDSTTLTVHPAPASPCTGDSGGPALQWIDGAEVVVGVTSKGDLACEAFAIETRVDVYSSAFIQPYLETRAHDPREDARDTGCSASRLPGGPGSSWAHAALLLAAASAATRRRARAAPSSAADSPGPIGV
jgi:secreted trypsin-like serine protease